MGGRTLGHDTSRSFERVLQLGLQVGRVALLLDSAR